MTAKEVLNRFSKIVLKTLWICTVICSVFFLAFVGLILALKGATSEMAAWVQAVGSVAAILAAIWIANRDSRFRRNIEKEARKGALVRATTAVRDAEARVVAGFEGAARLGVSQNFLNAVKDDFKNSETHLKEAMSIQGVDSSIYVQLYEARTAIEEAGQMLHFVSANPREGDAITARLLDARRNLEAFQSS